MKFAELVEYLERLEVTASRNEMTVILAELFSKLDPDEARIVVYMSQGKLGPAYKSPDFGVADKQMIKALGEEAGKLYGELGDLGRVAEKLKSQNPNDKSNSNFEIKDVYKKLTEIAEIDGTGSQELKIKLIGELTDSITGGEAKYVVKIILGKLRTGFSDMTVLDALSWMIVGDKSKRKDIENMYNVRADLGEICEELVKYKKPRKLDPVIGTPILMARAERAKNAGEIWKRNGECVVEYKLDGLRIQAHISKEVTLFSRGLENVTSMYPDIVEGLKKQIKKECIVEGEMIAVGDNGRFLPFQETVQRKRKYNIAEMMDRVPLRIYLFDLLLMDKTYSERRKLLEEMVGDGDTVRLMPQKEIKSAQEIEDFFQKALEDGTEGIVAKKTDGLYAAGARDFNWIKYKKSYQKSALVDTLDLVVMGYDFGQGKRTGFGIGDFLAGVYRPEDDKYLTVAKIGTGLTDDEWRSIKSKIQDTRNKSESYEVQKQMNCDVWVEPKVVVEIQADELTKSPMHTAGIALRFPRLISFRDKKPEDATTLSELERMYTLQQNGR